MVSQTRRFVQLFALGVSLVGVASCGGSSGSSQCKLADGNYSVRLTKVSGNCPDQIPESTVTLPDRSDGGDGGCHVTENAAVCSGSLSCTERDGTSTTTVVGTASLTNPASVSGMVTVTVSNSDGSPGCTGGYNFSMTRR